MENSLKLGFGLMRLPRKGLGIDIAETSRMVDAFLEAGGTYFDTAFVYPGSEEAPRKLHPGHEAFRRHDAHRENGQVPAPDQPEAHRRRLF